MKPFLRTLFFLCLLVFQSVHVLAQPNIDSLKNAAQNGETEKALEIYVQLGKYYRDVNPDSALYYGKLLINEAGQNQGMLAEGHGLLCVIYRIQSEYKAAIHHGLKAVSFYKQVKDSAGVSAAYSNLGNAYFYNSDLKMSLEYHLKALKIKEALNQPNGVASVLVNIGNVYIQQEQFPLARDHYKKSPRHFPGTKKPDGHQLLSEQPWRDC